jgi:hypothetical protein
MLEGALVIRERVRLFERDRPWRHEGRSLRDARRRIVDRHIGDVAPGVVCLMLVASILADVLE